MRWIIEDGIFSEQKRLESSINKISKFTHYDKDLKVDKYDIFYGSINTSFLLKGCQVWTKFNCSDYYPLFENLLNKEYILLPYGDLIKRKDFIFSIFKEEVFIRPNSGFKQFTGYTVKREDWENEIKTLKMFPNELVLLSSVKKISDEWRLLIAGESPRVITGSQYIADGEIVENPDHFVPRYVVDFANDQLSEDKNFYPAYTMDVGWCEDFGELKIIELNSFSCAGLYGMDFDLVVEAVQNSLLEVI